MVSHENLIVRCCHKQTSTIHAKRISLLGPGLNGFTGGSFNCNTMSFTVVEGDADEETKSLDDAKKLSCLSDADRGLWEWRRQNEKAVFR